MRAGEGRASARASISRARRARLSFVGPQSASTRRPKRVLCGSGGDNSLSVAARGRRIDNRMNRQTGRRTDKHGQRLSAAGSELRQAQRLTSEESPREAHQLATVVCACASVSFAACARETVCLCVRVCVSVRASASAPLCVSTVNHPRIGAIST